MRILKRKTELDKHGEFRKSAFTNKRYAYVTSSIEFCYFWIFTVRRTAWKDGAIHSKFQVACGVTLFETTCHLFNLFILWICRWIIQNTFQLLLNVKIDLKSWISFRYQTKFYWIMYFQEVLSQYQTCITLWSLAMCSTTWFGTQTTYGRKSSLIGKKKI